MRINQNISALNAYRNMVMTDNRLNKSLERLSSGLRINRAADDAAGLAISEKMRGQIRGLNQAMRNAQDGISYIQTAEGALNETHSILQRMRELSVQAASDTLTLSDRQEIQKEINQLTAEIDRIANTTEFNTKKLLDGTTSALTSTDKLSTKVFMRDGLRVMDQFGQKEAGGGNYRLDIEATPGTAEIQKTDIMKVKHEVGTQINYYNLGAIDNVTEGWEVAALREGVTLQFLGSAGATFGVNVTGDAVTITIDTGVDETYQQVVNEVAAHSAASTMLHFRHADMAAGAFTAAMTTSAATTLIGEGEIELTDPIMASGNLNYVEIDNTSAGLTIAALQQDVELVFIMDGTATTAQVTVNQLGAESYQIEVRAAGNLNLNDVVEEILAHSAAHTLIDIQYASGVDDDVEDNLFTDGTNVTPQVTFNLNGPGAYREIGDLATEQTRIEDIDRFWDASGNFLVAEPQTITLVQGDGAMAAFTIFRDDTIGEVVAKIDAAIRNEVTNNPGTIEVGKGLGQGNLPGVDENVDFAYFVTTPSEGGTFDTVAGTIVINSAIIGSAGEIKFSGNDDVINALSLTTIRESQESQFNVTVRNAHSDALVAEAKITGNRLVGTVHANVDVEFDAMANIDVKWTDEVSEQSKDAYDNPPQAFYFEQSAETYTTYVHLADNTTVFHIGANPLQDITAAIGDMRANALGVDNIQVTDRGSANKAISQIDSAISRVSAERSKMGALQNRLEHTINNLGVSAENLTAAESRIRDLDFAMEMIEFTRNQIMMQAGTAMLAQANMKPQSVLMLLG